MLSGLTPEQQLELARHHLIDGHMPTPWGFALATSASELSSSGPECRRGQIQIIVGPRCDLWIPLA